MLWQRVGLRNTTTSIYTRLRLKQSLHCASQPLHDARCQERAVATGSKQCKLPYQRATITQIQSGGDAATRSQHLLSRRSDATVFSPRETARTTTSICTRTRLKQSLHCASQPLHDARCQERAVATGSKQCKLPYQRSTINSEPVRWRCGDSQLTPPQSQVGRSRVSRALAARETVQRDNIHLHMTQTEAITALRVSTAARCTMHEKAATNGS